MQQVVAPSTIGTLPQSHPSMRRRGHLWSVSLNFKQNKLSSVFLLTSSSDGSSGVVLGGEDVAR